MKLRAWGALVAAGWLLTACAALSPPEASAISGRIAVHVDSDPPRSFAGAFDLRGDARAGSLRLSGPLGTTAAEARWAPGLARLRTTDGSTDYADTEALTRAALGATIPLAALFDWLRGRPWNDAPASTTADPAGFEQLGWRIDLSRRDQGWIEASRDAPPRVTVRARLEAPG